MKQTFSLFIILTFSFAHSQIDALARESTKPRTLAQRWELDTTATRGTFLITPYKPIYLLPGRWTSRPNDIPASDNPSPEYIAQRQEYDNIETRFQISFKTKILQGIFWNTTDLWGAYTQVCHWQVYNNALSRPFREVNYEPELILNVPLRFKIFGFHARLAQVAFNHQSNGRSTPYSRSWNRVIFNAGFERKDWTVYIRPWIRIHDSTDDNPDITDYIGRADLNVIYTHKTNVFSLIGSHNLSFGTAVKGNLTFSWSHRIKGNLKGFLQASHGYGETLIDYNYKQTTVGIGVSLVEWL